MARLIQTGANTFKYVEDEPGLQGNYLPSQDEMVREKMGDLARRVDMFRQQQQQQQPVPAPVDDRSGQRGPDIPRPVANVSPVYELKNRTANKFFYQPGARQRLYDTPTAVEFDDQANAVGGGYATGQYFSPVVRYEDGTQSPSPYSGPQIRLYSATNRDTPDTLNHEFAHLWYDQVMPPDVRANWDASHQNLSGNYADTRWNRDYVGGGFDFLGNRPTEYFAFNVEDDPYAMDPDTRRRYYAGMYQGDPTSYSPMPPVPPMMNSRWQSPLLPPSRDTGIRPDTAGNWG